MTGSGLRRHERELTDPGMVAAIIAAATICRVAFADDDEPYVLPLNFGHESVSGSIGGRFWFHSATAGRKVGLLATEPRVCVQLDEDLGLVTHPDKACAWTQAYRSVLAWGTARPARDRDEARHGLDVLMRQHGGGDGWTYPEAVLDRTLVWCVEIERLSAKQHLVEAEGV